MLEITIPGYKVLRLQHLVLDYNGTLACDGALITGVSERLTALAEQLQIHVLTADTFGTVKAALADIPCRFSVLPLENQDIGKLNYVQQLGTEQTVTMGNGRNDRLMLKQAVLGVAILQTEGVAVETLMAADVVVPDMLAGLDLLLQPLRLIATLRS